VLDPVPGMDLDGYKAELINRFGNPNIKDSVSRICSESSAKLPNFLIPTINDNLRTGGSIEYATLVIAAWCYYSDKGLNRHGAKMEIMDEIKVILRYAAKGTDKDPLSFLRLEFIFGDLITNNRFTSFFTEMVLSIYADSNIINLMKK